MGVPKLRALPRKRLGELLLDGGLIDEAGLERALALQAERGGRLGTHMLILGLVNEGQLAGFLSHQLGLPSLHRLGEVEPAAVRLVPAKVAIRFQAVPVRLHRGRLLVAMADPFDAAALEALAEASGRAVMPVVAPELVVAYAVRKFYAPEDEHRPNPADARPQFSRGSALVLER